MTGAMKYYRRQWAETAEKIRTFWFLTAMIPLMLLAGCIGILSLILTSPLMVYANIRGKHLKDPWGKAGDLGL